MDPMEPVAARDRIVVIDVLRGVALFGIVVANMRGFNSPLDVYMRPSLVWDSAADRLAQFLVDCLVTGKFITIFGILFGFGFAMQAARAAAKGEAFTRVHLRRMFVLLLIGAAHAFLVWWGDILLIYACLGFLLLAVWRAPRDNVMLWLQVLYWFPLFLFAASLALLPPGGAAEPADSAVTGEAVAEAIRIYTTGSFGEVAAQRFRDWLAFNAGAPFYLPRVFSFFLFGIWMWRAGLVRDLNEHAPRLRRYWPWLLGIGLAANAVYAGLTNFTDTDVMAPAGRTVLLWAAASAGIPALALFYMSAVALLFRRPRWRRLLEPFAAVGRAALTNYLVQSVAGVWLLHELGWGRFGQTGPAVNLALAAIIYAAQAAVSVAWLRRFRFGPMEWLWRSATYGRWQPMTK